MTRSTSRTQKCLDRALDPAGLAGERGRGATITRACECADETFTRRVQLVRRDARDVSTLYGREGGARAPFLNRRPGRTGRARPPPLPAVASPGPPAPARARARPAYRQSRYSPPPQSPLCRHTCRRALLRVRSWPERPCTPPREHRAARRGAGTRAGGVVRGLAKAVNGAVRADRWSDFWLPNH